MDWKLKAEVFRALSVMPAGESVLLQLQKRVTREVPRRASVLSELLVAARRILDQYLEHADGATVAHASFLEIGAGRDLAVALALRMLGVGKVTCVDIGRLARVELVQHAATHLAAELGQAAPVFRAWSDVEAFGITYRAPATLDRLVAQHGQFACFCSTDVLEHIPRVALPGVLVDARKLLTPEGLAIHAIDYSDHYARSHSGLSRFNFLTFSSADWGKYNPSLHYVNRLRHSEFVRLFNEAGYELVLNQPTVAAADESILRQLADEFKELSVDDLFTLRAWVVGRRSGLPAGGLPAAV